MVIKTGVATSTSVILRGIVTLSPAPSMIETEEGCTDSAEAIDRSNTNDVSVIPILMFFSTEIQTSKKKVKKISIFMSK